MVHSVKLVPKTWGMEAWFYNGDYCGKRLTFAEDHRCSIHYHKKKHETFLIIDGCFLVELWVITGEGKTWGRTITHTLRAGDTIIIKPYLAHRMTAIGGNSSLIEFSTHHEDEDSYRIESGQVWE